MMKYGHINMLNCINLEPYLYCSTTIWSHPHIKISKKTLWYRISLPTNDAHETHDHTIKYSFLLNQKGASKLSFYLQEILMKMYRNKFRYATKKIRWAVRAQIMKVSSVIMSTLRTDQSLIQHFAYCNGGRDTCKTLVELCEVHQML